MDQTVLALLAVGGTLGGVALGSLLQEVTGRLADRRTSNRDARAAARLVAGDLLQAHAVITAALTAGKWDALSLDALETPRWAAHQGTLAGVLPRQDWRLLRIAFGRLRGAHTAAQRYSGPLDPTSIMLLAGAARMARDSAVLLDAIADQGLLSRGRLKANRELITAHLNSVPQISDIIRATQSSDPKTGESDDGPPGPAKD